nr:hypothetical protein [Allobranchiibius sp. CTAmp26]
MRRLLAMRPQIHPVVTPLGYDVKVQMIHGLARPWAAGVQDVDPRAVEGIAHSLRNLLDKTSDRMHGTGRGILHPDGVLV